MKLEDLQGGTFTITNGGVYGSLFATPILNPPQSGILGMHKIMPRPVAVDGKVEVRPMMYLALSYDHRAIDGKEAVTFLIKVKECIEDPKKLPLDFQNLALCHVEPERMSSDMLIRISAAGQICLAILRFANDEDNIYGKI